jgi:hypothetical protein
MFQERPILSRVELLSVSLVQTCLTLKDWQKPGRDLAQVGLLVGTMSASSR